MNQLWNFERAIIQSSRRESMASENQAGFILDKSRMKAIYLLNRLTERSREKQEDLHMVSCRL